MRVLKFGGSSVGTPETLRQVVDIIKGKKGPGPLAVVVSAFRGVTDMLAHCAELASEGDAGYVRHLKELESRHVDTIRSCISVYRQSEVLARFKMTFNELEDVLAGILLVRELTPRTLDFVLAFGERFSAYILSQCLNEREVKSEYVDARQFITTDIRFGSARVLADRTANQIRNFFKKRETVTVITGFIASTEKGETSTLGRGGSDYTAALLGAALKAEIIEIWTDVDGILTADPGKVSDARTIGVLSYEEAMELSHFGAKVIYPPTLQPAMKAGIPIVICNTFNPENKGTRIERNPSESGTLIKGISSIEQIALVTVRGSGMIGVSGIAARMFKSLASASVNIIMITQASSEHSICVAVHSDSAGTARKTIENEFRMEIQDEMIDQVQVENDLCIVAVVGDLMQRTPGIAGRVFRSLGDGGINIIAIAQGSSERIISFIVHKNDEPGALNALHKAFFS